MRTKLKHIIATGLMMLGLMALPVALVSDTSYAATPKREVCEGVQGIGGGDCTGASLNRFIQNVINILLFIIGAVAVIMIIIGGLRFITSNGDQSQVKAGRETVLYAVIGLIVAIMAYSIVNFVVFRL